MAVAPGSSHWAVNGRGVLTSAYRAIQPKLLVTGRLSMKVRKVSWNLDISYFLMCMLSVLNAFNPYPPLGLLKGRVINTILKEPTSNS